MEGEGHSEARWPILEACIKDTSHSGWGAS